MKHFKQLLSLLSSANTLAWIAPVLLIVPNIVLAITEGDSILVKITDITLPLGVYYIIVALSSAVGRTVVLMLPFMILAAFQIVLLYLYGESIIAIDMFLNVATTNAKEVSELLSNLILAIITVVVLYLPILVWSIILTIKKVRCAHELLLKVRKTGLFFTAIGLVLMTVSWLAIPDFSIRRNIFPVNVIANMIEAVNRTIKTSNYHLTSADYTFQPTLTHKDGNEVYVLIIGETSRADNWEIFGYQRPTNPKLSVREGLIAFPKTLSESNTTHKSVPMLLSPLTASNFGDSIYYTKGICTAFNEAGFNTAFFSNQQRNHSFIDFFGYQAQTTEFIRDNHPESLDNELVNHLREFIEKSPSEKLFIILHSYGSHFNYHERYDDAHRTFTPDMAYEASAENRRELINAYDNTIVFTDDYIDDVITLLDSLNIPASVIYTSDHGEDIFDDERGRFLHASPTTTFTQIHVPFVAWLSDEYREQYPGAWENMKNNSQFNVSSTRSIFPTVLSIAGIKSPKVENNADLSSKLYTEPSRQYLNDYNEAVNLRQAGFRKQDIKNAKNSNISIE